jgi:hypothetical protein
MDLSFDKNPSRSARFKRELRNPSLLTVFIIGTIAAVVILAPFAPGWVSTAQGSFKAMAQAKDLGNAGRSSITVIIPSQITPWLSIQARTMINAEGPLEWRVVSFRNGPCNSGNLSQLPAGKYTSAIAQACVDLDDIQQRYSGKCFLASDCNVPEVAKDEIRLAMDTVWDAFSDAGFVLPYTEEEQQVFP